MIVLNGCFETANLNRCPTLAIPFVTAQHKQLRRQSTVAEAQA